MSYAEKRLIQLFEKGQFPLMRQNPGNCAKAEVDYLASFVAEKLRLEQQGWPAHVFLVAACLGKLPFFNFISVSSVSPYQPSIDNNALNNLISHYISSYPPQEADTAAHYLNLIERHVTATISTAISCIAEGLEKIIDVHIKKLDAENKSMQAITKYFLLKTDWRTAIDQKPAAYSRQIKILPTTEFETLIRRALHLLKAELSADKGLIMHFAEKAKSLEGLLPDSGAILVNKEELAAYESGLPPAYPLSQTPLVLSQTPVVAKQGSILAQELEGLLPQKTIRALEIGRLKKPVRREENPTLIRYSPITSCEELMQKTPAELSNIKGIGQVVLGKILAAVEQLRNSVERTA